MSNITTDLNVSIYTISCKDLAINNVYVGSTSNFYNRKCNHKHHCNNPNSDKYNFNIYKYIRENGGWDNWDVIEIEKIKCNSKLEAIQRERYWYERLNAKLNTNKPNRTHKEYYHDNSEKYCKLTQEYYRNHKEQINNRRNEKFTCECGGSFTLRNKSTHYKTNAHTTKSPNQ